MEDDKMGAYTTEMVTDENIKDIIFYLRKGYEFQGVKHRSNYKVATIVLLQANLGCRIGDIIHLTVENFVFDGDTWRLDMIEEKTGKVRRFVVPTPVKAVIDQWMKQNGITTGSLFTKMENHAVHKQLRAVTGFLEMKNVSGHSFRKSAGFRTYKKSGYDIAAVSQFYNHSSPSITLNYLKRSSKQMDELLSDSVIMV
jgi:integrase